MPADIAFVVTRVRPRLDLILNAHTRARAVFELHQDGDTTTYEAGDTTITVPSYDDGWTIQPVRPFTIYQAPQGQIAV